MPMPTITADQREALYESNGMPIVVLDRVRMEKLIMMDESLYRAAVEALREHDPYTAEILEHVA